MHTMHTWISVVMAVVLSCGASALGADEAEQVNPFPRQVQVGKVLKAWRFDAGAEGWHNLARCELTAAAGTLKITCLDEDPYVGAPVDLPTARDMVIVRLRARSTSGGGGEFFWTTREDPNLSARRRQGFAMVHDGKWHDYQAPLPVGGRLKLLRLDPGQGKGVVELDYVEVREGGPHPLEIVRLGAGADGIRGWIKNHGREPRTVAVLGQERTIAPGATAEVTWPAKGKAAFEAVTVEVTPSDKALPPLKRTTVIARPTAAVKWIELADKSVPAAQGQVTVQVAPDGSGALIRRAGRLVAMLAPIVLRDGRIPRLAPAERTPAMAAFAGAGGLAVRLELAGGELRVRIDAPGEVEGPVVRALGGLEQGVLAGLEYLGKGERSSSTLDIETSAHLRFAPNPLLVTMPLAAFVTDQASVAMTWRDMSLRPTYATPNFFDGAADHRMGLRGKVIDATVRVTGEKRVEPAIQWAVEKLRGLGDLPKPPRTRAQQWQLAMSALKGPISGAGGWGHCAESKWVRHPYADIASTIWRITGEAPKLDRLTPGGAHVPNDAVYFATGRATEWLAMRAGQVASLIRRQRKDGSYGYKGKYSRGHFEDTASGACAYPARLLLEFAWLTGDPKALAAGCKTLDYMTRFRTPRGAQTWELSLHTPDILASANLVWAYVRGYELTGKPEYLARARRWALSGVPFVYLWGRADLPTMTYATPPVFGATNWRAPLWIGLPVQWCGGVYAYALTKLAPHDKTLDWSKLARGILIAGEQMMYPDGKLAGCLPDVFELASQRRAGPSINPCAMASLRMALAGEVDSLAAAGGRVGGKQRRVAGPFAIEIVGAKAVIHARKGVKYQVLVDGSRVVDVTSKGIDEVALE